MEITGELLYVTGTAVGSIGLTAGVFFLYRIWRLVARFDRLEEEFLNFWKRNIKDPTEEEVDLKNLSHTYRALKRQLESHGSLKNHVLNRALKKAREKKKLFMGGKINMLHYAAWKKLRELKSEVEKDKNFNI